MRDMLSIVHFFPRIRLAEGGVVQNILDTCRLLAQKGHRITLATCDAEDVPQQWWDEHSNPKAVQLAKSPCMGSLLSKSSVEQFAELALQADIVHLHTPWELSNLQLAKVLRHIEKPYLVTVHGMLDDYSMQQKSLKKKIFLALFGKRFFQRATEVHFTAEAEREQAMNWISGSFLQQVQACAVDLSPYDNLPGPELARSTFQLSSGKPKILFLSRVHPKKGLDRLIKAVRVLDKQGIDAELLVAGPGEQSYIDTLLQLAHEQNVDAKIKFLGMVQGQVKLSLYQAADVFVLPTHQENFGLVLPEALACGTPVITTRGTDIWHELAEAGAIIVENEPDKIADAISHVLSNEQKRKALGEQGQAYVRKWLAKENVLAGYEKMYFDAIQHSKGASVS